MNDCKGCHGCCAMWEERATNLTQQRDNAVESAEVRGRALERAEDREAVLRRALVTIRNASRSMDYGPLQLAQALEDVHHFASVALQPQAAEPVQRTGMSASTTKE